MFHTPHLERARHAIPSALLSFGMFDHPMVKQVPEDGLTLFEAKSWVKGLLGRSPYLAKLFGVAFRFSELSSYQRQTATMATQFEMGLVALPDLKYHAAKEAVRNH